MKTNFKIGDKVKLKDYSHHCDHREHEGETANVIFVGENMVSIEWADDSTSCVWENSGVYKTKKGEKVKPEDDTRYIVYGTGCDNKSDLFKTEADLKKELKKVALYNDWTGRIIGYKLVPLYEAEKVVRLKGLMKSVKITKKKGKVGRPKKTK